MLAVATAKELDADTTKGCSLELPQQVPEPAKPPPATPELGTTEGGEDSVQDDNDNVGGSSEGSDDESGSEPLINVTGALPSIGSALHASGKCSRCCFYLKPLKSSSASSGFTHAELMGAALALRCGPACCNQLSTECEEESIGLVGFESLSVLDWGQGLVNGEPVGRILEENVLSQTDCDLLSFAGSSALVAVRWLLYLGANAEVADGNNTSALHAACRSGSLVLVKQFIKQTVLLNSQDVAGWTPLHIAAHMGRKAVALRLLQAQADPSIVNSRGLKPADLCKDTGTYQVIVRFSGGEQATGPRPFARGVLGGSSPSPANAFHDEEPDEAGEALSDLVGLPQQCEPELFFVNPRPVFHHTAVHRKALLSLASAIFNLQPSHGLALVVLMGLEESYTGAMKVLLKHGAVSRQLAGSFLGEPLSVCPLIRFSYFDGLPLLNTGVVSCLRTVFSSLGIPQELQKLDRLLWAIASVWWRKHKALKDSGRAVAIKQQARANHLGAEFTGFDFVYVPYDRHKLVNISLAFINFTDSRAAKEAQEFFHLLNDAHAAWNIVACAGNVQGFSFNAAYYVARFGIRAIHDAHAPVLFKNGMQLTDRMEISRLYASLPTSTLQGAKDFVKAERGGSSQRGTARRAHDLIWQPTESRLPAGPDYGWSDSHKQLRDNVKAMMPAGLAPANSVFSSPPSTRSPSSEPDGLKLSASLCSQILDEPSGVWIFSLLELLSYLSSQEVLYQLLYSSVLLHRRVWGGYSSVPLGPMELETWAELNSGIERHGEDDVPQHVQTRIFTDISTSRVPELSAWERGNLALVAQNGVGAETIPEEALPGPIGAATDAYLAAESRKASNAAVVANEESSALQHRATVEGWLWVHTGALLPGSLGSSEWAQNSTFSSDPVPKEGNQEAGGPHRVWGSLCSMCLVFSSQAPSAVAVPHAVMDCRGLQVLDIVDEAPRRAGIVGQAKVVTLAAQPRIGAESGQAGSSTRRASEDLIRAAKLLPDGRWEVGGQADRQRQPCLAKWTGRCHVLCLRGRSFALACRAPGGCDGRLGDSLHRHSLSYGPKARCFTTSLMVN
ncbi:Unconventional myosin-XVI [Symbiodinium microadriaticum]|uniref:Unconventional myosin-XVI n=1 Tax=Symbiodinium microadriaticum TaxID=2951 RepID=A0A1Q9F7I2_SYMMI|nr:Unconventional myosin-XVI [Symbiodinium microadriaticum]